MGRGRVCRRGERASPAREESGQHQRGRQAGREDWGHSGGLCGCSVVTQTTACELLSGARDRAESEWAGGVGEGKEKREQRGERERR